MSVSVTGNGCALRKTHKSSMCTLNKADLPCVHTNAMNARTPTRNTLHTVSQQLWLACIALQGRELRVSVKRWSGCLQSTAAMLITPHLLSIRRHGRPQKSTDSTNALQATGHAVSDSASRDWPSKLSRIRIDGQASQTGCAAPSSAHSACTEA